MMRWILLVVGLLSGMQAMAADITVGSKADREGHMLGELFAQTLEHEGFSVDRRFGLGQTIVSWQALKGGDIDVYPEYTGTMAQALFDMPGADIETLRREAERRGVRVLEPLGFNNTYALTMKASEARALGLETISDLAQAPPLKLGLSHEFIERDDGWKGLSRTYNLPQVPVGIEHGIAYQAIVDDRIDMTDAYSTDGDLDRLNLMLLEDDRHYFPEYLAVPFVRDTLPDKAVDALDQLAGMSL